MHEANYHDDVFTGLVTIHLNRFFGHAMSHARRKLSILYWAFRDIVEQN